MRAGFPLERRVVTGLGLVWALVMVALGLGVLSGWPRGYSAGVSGWLGVTALAGGQFVFMVLVSDRLFPRASRPLVLVVEGLTLLVFLAGVAVTVVRLTEGIRQ